MELNEMKIDEQIAFVALLKNLVLADGNVTPDEREWVEDMADAMGQSEYRFALEEVDRRFPDEKTLKEFLAKIERPEARDLIYGTIFEAALNDAVEGKESQLLDWLAKEWKIEVSYEKQDEAGDEG